MEIPAGAIGRPSGVLLLMPAGSTGRPAGSDWAIALPVEMIKAAAAVASMRFMVLSSLNRKSVALVIVPDWLQV